MNMQRGTLLDMQLHKKSELKKGGTDSLSHFVRGNPLGINRQFLSYSLLENKTLDSVNLGIMSGNYYLNQI